MWGEARQGSEDESVKLAFFFRSAGGSALQISPGRTSNHASIPYVARVVSLASLDDAYGCVWKRGTD
jgi:hypothetical protein